MTSSIFQYPLITYDVIDDVIEVRAPKNKYDLESSYEDANLGIFSEGIGSQTKKL